MAKQHRTREGDVTAANTKTALTTVGSETAPGALFVPQGMTHITNVRVACVQNMAVADSFSGFIRIEGNGMTGGPQTLAAIAGGVPVATGGNALNYPLDVKVNFPVSESNIIELYAEMGDTDPGGVSFAVTLTFSDKPNEGADEHKTLTVEGDITAADTRSALTTQGSNATPTLAVPAGFTKIDKILCAAASNGLADGKNTWLLRIGGNAVRGGEQVFAVSASGRIAVQSGSDAAPEVMSAIVFEDVDIAVSPSDNISLWAEMAGDDTGTGHLCATLVFAK